MRLRDILLGAAALPVLLGTALAQPPTAEAIRAATGRVDQAHIAANARTGEEWPSYGLNHAENRFSPLADVNADTVGRLGLAWTYDLESKRGVEATPLVVGGVMYVTASWSVVHAIDAKTGARLWTYDPQVPRDYAYAGCCDIVNRGVALHKGRVFVASYDGRLIALDAATGSVVWSKDTIIDRTRRYTITGAPRVFAGNVVIGNGGAEYGVRGYLTAYDPDSGEQKWRWFAVPGDPSKPFEDASMERAAKTWDPAGKWWEAGGGGTMWDSFVYDPELNLIYVGTGNGSPWNAALRSPAGGDNLYLGSIVALNAATGAYVWHFQETPGDNWDYTSTQPLVLADLAVGGRTRKVVLHAPKNGFFYVVDRETGQLISARNFVEVNWASGYDESGRPIEIAGARERGKGRETIPTAFGAHNWHPMSFNPVTGLAYIPAQGVPLSLTHDPDWKFNANLPGRAHSNLGWNLGFLVNAIPPQAKPFGHLLAWDPVTQKEVWRQEYVSPWNGGTLTTAGMLVFQGTADGRFVAYDARDGKALWQTPVGSGAVAGAATYRLDGVQYVSIAVGWGGVYGIAQRATERVGPGRVYTFTLDGKTPMPAFVQNERKTMVSGLPYRAEDVAPGAALYVSNCAFCHGVPGVNNGGNVPNLAYSSAGTIDALPALLLNGTYVEQGMPNFHGKLGEAQAGLIRAFVLGTVDAVRPK